MEEGIKSGVSGAYTGLLNGTIIQAGGCNFPSNPMAPDSQKKFYQGIYAIIPQDDGNFLNEQIGLLPSPMGYGLGLTSPEGLFILGGTTPTEAQSEVTLLTQDSNGKIEFTTYPSLPGTMDNFTGAYIDGKIYVGGGNYDGQPSNRFFSLDIKNPENGWIELPSFPGNPRVQPVMAATKNSKGEKGIYLWGGFAGKSVGRNATLNTDGYRYDIEKRTWNALPAPKNNDGVEISTGGGIATVLADGRIVVIGGVNKDIFLSALQNQAPDYLSHPVEWYKFNDNVLVFDPLKEQWKVETVNSGAARAGAGMVTMPNDEIVIMGGEIKPRIRTADVLKLKIN